MANPNDFGKLAIAAGNDHDALAALARIGGEIEHLRAEVRHLGEMGDVCTFNALGEICAGCRCGKKIGSQQLANSEKKP